MKTWNTVHPLRAEPHYRVGNVDHRPVFVVTQPRVLHSSEDEQVTLNKGRAQVCGVIQCISGFVDIVVASFMIYLCCWGYWLGAGFWCGGLYMMAGLLGITSRYRPSSCHLVSTLIWSLVALWFAVVSIVLSVIAYGIELDDEEESVHVPCMARAKYSRVLNGLAVFAALTEIIAAVFQIHNAWDAVFKNSAERIQSGQAEESIEVEMLPTFSPETTVSSMGGLDFSWNQTAQGHPAASFDNTVSSLGSARFDNTVCSFASSMASDSARVVPYVVPTTIEEA